MKNYFMKKFKILAINVCLRPYMPQILFPLGLSYIIGAIHRASYDLELLDLDKNRKTNAEIEKFLKNKDFDAALFGCIVTGYKIVKELSEIIRKANQRAVIIVGNSVADSIPRILLEKTEADVAVMGEGEITIADVLDKLAAGQSLEAVKGIWYKQGGKIFDNPKRSEVEDINALPFPEWEIFGMETYIRGMRELVSEPFPLSLEKIRPFLVNAARGCPFCCSFCYQVFQSYPYRHRSADSIISEIKELQKRYRVNYIFLHDDLSFPTKEYVKEFVDKIFSENLTIFWTATCRSNLFNSGDDLALLKRLKQSGCIGFQYSLESANQEILKAMNKRLSINDFITQKKLLDKAGLISWTSLVFGYPQETKKTIKETMDLCYELNIYPSVGYLLPQPGTPMYNYIFEQGIVSDEEQYLLSLGDRQDLRINLTKMDPEEFRGEITRHLMRISDKLNLGLSEKTLIKTVHFKAVNKKNE